MPPLICPTIDAQKEFRNLVKTYPTMKPIALSMGAKHWKAPHEIHLCYANDDKMRSKRKKIIKEESAFHPSNLIV